jgi:hypothetical protein
MAYTELYPSPPYRLEHNYKIENHQVVETKEIVVHTFQLSDVEDPEIYAAESLLEWQNSEQGQWVMEHATEPPKWHKNIDYVHYGYKFAITAKLKGSDISYYMLKWGKP